MSCVVKRPADRIETNTVDTPNFPIGCNRLQPIGMLGVSPNFGANGSITSNTSVLLASRREIVYRLIAFCRCSDKLEVAIG